MQDAKFADRVLDLANLVLVGLIGPEAHKASAAAQDPAKAQVGTAAMQTSCCCTTHH